MVLGTLRTYQPRLHSEQQPRGSGAVAAVAVFERHQIPTDNLAGHGHGRRTRNPPHQNCQLKQGMMKELLTGRIRLV